MVFVLTDDALVLVFHVVREGTVDHVVGVIAKLFTQNNSFVLFMGRDQSKLSALLFNRFVPRVIHLLVRPHVLLPMLLVHG